MSIATKILKLTKGLYPQGRAFKVSGGSNLEKLHRAFAVSETQAYNDACSILNNILPDNSNFTTGDASQWEERLGMINGDAVALADRKLAIKRKMQHPGNIPARQHYLYLEGQLQAAGFSVYVHENRFDLYPDTYETQNPRTIYGSSGWVTNLHGTFLHGQALHGQYYSDIIANSIASEGDLSFNLGSNLRSTFFIGGQTLGTFANVDAEREAEFRQLILKIKPVQTVGFLFINYI
jgi:hypothetical protein